MAQSFLIKNSGGSSSNLKAPFNVYDPATGDTLVNVSTDSSDEALLQLGAVKLTDKNGDLYVNGQPIGTGGDIHIPFNVYDQNENVVMRVSTDSSDDACLELGTLSIKDKNNKLYVDENRVLIEGEGGYVSPDLTINGHALTSDITITKADVGLGNVDNTSDLNKPISTATQTALDTKATTATYTATITTTWTGASAPYSQEISVQGILATDNPFVDIVLSSTYSTAQTEQEEFVKIFKITTSANAITVYASEQTTIALTIQLKVVR